ncbi:tannase/feruloyl esterase family alpha/beta hydrolase [Pseudoxanthomonas sp.]|uniref:tannase/feruloyl esterase family alpha/beta hydrolase n=1 Tax=Pseudoxanthomonas sp. TaxID=1871049 RepID=UPI0026077CB0|nr:tannase/feruloyl esterase family alpha/beta hydrolase [Pseudoxanthomonas sp.]WDS35109.1 MAG: tannase/feruloyl esterase family alpha/beta hydrolase [Pseudoxanthomonas sp.]
MSIPPRGRSLLLAGSTIMSLLLLMAGCSQRAPAPAPPGTPAAKAAAAPSPGKALAVVAPVQACTSLTAADLTDIGGAGSKVTKADQADIDGRSVCQVEVTLAPSINIQVRMPLEGWTQRYMQLGCGGLCGNINMQVGAADGCVPSDSGAFVLAATDMGHQGMSGDFGYDPQKRADFAYRAQHLTAVATKKLVKLLYGQDPAYSYFNGCSDGGREALVEAQRFPDDFSGIIAGAPALIFQVQNSLHHGWLAVSNTSADGGAVLIADRLPLLHSAVLKACDALDGIKDGLVAEPRLCHFDPGILQCASGTADTSQCLTSAEVETVRKIYDGPRDPKTGERLLVGGPQYGSELNWAGVFVPIDAKQGVFSKQIVLGALNGLIFDDGKKDVSLADLKFETATYDKLRPRHPLFDATNPDLSGFADAGGKLMLWHGWGDQHISPINTIAYHEAVEKQMGHAKVEAFERLYLLPGVAHCGGGEGPSSFDLLSPMMDWVERGIAPGAFVAHPAATASQSSFGQPGGGKSGGKGDLPPLPAGVKPEDLPPLPSGEVATAKDAIKSPFLICPYPSIAAAAKDGQGVDGTHQTCGAPLFTEATPDWAGKDFFQPYAPRE